MGNHSMAAVFFSIVGIGKKSSSHRLDENRNGCYFLLLKKNKAILKKTVVAMGNHSMAAVFFSIVGIGKKSSSHRLDEKRNGCYFLLLKKIKQY